MSRLLWLFLVLVAVDGKPSNCEQKEKTLAVLDLAEDSLNKAKDLYPNCGQGVTTEELTTDVTTEVQTTDVTREDCRPMDCQDLMAAGYQASGVYTVWPRSRIIRGKAVQVLCDMDTDGGGWTIIQRRGNFSRQEEFNRDWQDYKNGFGNLTRDFWIGNDIIHSLSNQGGYSLRIDMSTVDGVSAWALHRDFWIEDESSNYTLHVDQYNGTAGDCLQKDLNGMKFSTNDSKNDLRIDADCARLREGGFWFNKCGWCNPNGVYKPGEDRESNLHYERWTGYKKYVGLLSMEMKLKRM